MPRPLHIITHEFYPRHGGIATYTDEMARAAANAGYDVTVYAPGAELDHLQLPYAIHQLPVRGTQGWLDRTRLFIALRRSARNWSDDAIVYLPEPGPIRLWMYARPALKKVSATVVTLHGSEVNRLSRPFYRRAAATRFLNSCQHVGLVSRAMLDRFETRFPAVTASRALVPGGIRTFIRQAAEENRPSRASKPFRWLTVARIHPRKGQLDVVEALGQLPAEQRSRVVYELVGPVRRPAYRDEIARRAKELGVEVVFRGAVSDAELVDAYRRADGFVMAPKAVGASVEGLGLALLEAQAMRVPVVATRSGGTAEALDRGRTGLLVSSREPHGLSRSMARLMEDATLHAELSARGHDFVLNGFSWDENVQRLFGNLATELVPPADGD